MGRVERSREQATHRWLRQIGLPDFIHLREIVIADVLHTMVGVLGRSMVVRDTVADCDVQSRLDGWGV